MLKKVLGITFIFAAASLAPFAVVHAQGYGRGGDAVDCTSRNYGYQRCDVPWRDAQIVRQLSDTQCIRGKNWGIDRKGLWVDRGCAGRFVAAGGRGDRDRDGPYAGGGGWQPDPSWNQRFSVTCESQDGRDHFCQVDLGGGGRAYLERQLSSTPCVEGRNWGSNRAGVWVAGGCRAVFSIDRRWR